jgi:hypothetical protein
MNKKKFLKLQRETITDVDLIPKDTLYCYTPDEERNKNKDSWKYYYIKLCPYYVWGKGNMRGCLHLKGYLLINILNYLSMFLNNKLPEEDSEKLLLG